MVVGGVSAGIAVIASMPEYDEHDDRRKMKG